MPCYGCVMVSAMANTKVRLLRRVKTDAGWKHFPAAYAANGRVKPGMVIVAGHEVNHQTGYYELRYYEGSKIVFESLKDASPAAAEAKRQKKAAQLSVVKAAGKADVKLSPPDPKRKVLGEQLKLFLAATLDRGSVEAEEVYRLACNEFLEVTKRQYVDEIVEDDILMFQKALTERGMGKRTVCNRHSSVKAFLLFLGIDTKGLPKPPKPDKTMPEIFKDDELKALLKRVTTPKENLLYRFLLQTGAREGEAMHVEWSDLDTESKTIQFHSKPKWHFRMKDFEERAVPVPPDLIDRLIAYKHDHPQVGTLIFPKAGKPDGHMLRTLKQKVRAAGLNCGHCEGCSMQNPKRSPECGNWFLHKFRATYCTKMLRNRRDIRTVQALMGHGDLQSTMRYVRPAENEETQAAISKMKWF